MTFETEFVLYQIHQRIYRKVGQTLVADRLLAPLNYYVATGRCDGSFVRKLNKLTARQMTTIANRLMKFSGFGDYAEPIEAVTSYIATID